VSGLFRNYQGAWKPFVAPPFGLSFDGYIARPNGACDFLFKPKDYSTAPFFAAIDTAIMGRKTFEAASQMGGGSFGGSSMATYIFSHSLPPSERDGIVFINHSPASFMRQLRPLKGRVPQPRFTTVSGERKKLRIY